MLASLLNDVRYALRGFARRPLFATVVVLTLALGIGVNVAMFSIFEQVLLRPLPVPEPERLVNFSSPGVGRGHVSCNNAGNCDSVFSYPMFRDLQRLEGPFFGIAAHRYFAANMAYAGETYSGYAMLVSGNYFSVLGVVPALGRLIAPGDDAIEGEANAAALSYDYWQNALGGDTGVVGRTLVVNGKPLTIVGVAPAGFRGTTVGQSVQVYVPITLRWSANPNAEPNFDDRRDTWAYLFARLKPGVTIGEAAAAINPGYHAIINDVEAPRLGGLTEKDLAAFRAKTLQLTPGAQGQSSVRDNARSPLSLLLVATSLVLLIACVNVANLMLVRGAGRTGEVAVRASLGASSSRIAALLSVEALLLALLSAAASVPLTALTLRGIGSMLPAYAESALDFRLDTSTLAAATGFGLAAAVVFGLAPALKLVRSRAGHVLRSEGARATGGRGTTSFLAALATAQIGLSMALLVLAGWFAQSLVNATRVDLGIRADALFTFEVAPARSGYAPGRAAQLIDRLEDELSALPGMTSVASSRVALLTDSDWGSNVSIEGVDTGPGVDTHVWTNYVSPGFFATLSIPLLAGRNIAATDTSGQPKVAIVNERFLEKFGLDRTVIGKRMAFGQGNGPLDMEIVGIVQDAKYSNVKTPTPPQVFAPRAQLPVQDEATFYVRSGLDAAVVRNIVEQTLSRMDSTLPLKRFEAMQDVVRENLFIDRFLGALALGLASLATLLASLGLYGVLSYGVALRTREIGLRLALGAPAARLRTMVLKQVAWMTAIGGTLGIAAALLLGRAARSLLFELSPSDPYVLCGAVLVLGAVVLAAGYLPARRASRVDPVVALRSE